MHTDTITHDVVAHLVEAGAIRAARVVGQKGGWSVRFQYGATERPLAAQRGNVRLFRHFETLVSYLRKIGIVQFDVDATAYDPSAPLSDKTQSQVERARAQMQAAHAAVAYDQWFAAEIDAALAEADDPAVRHVSHADAMGLLDAALTRATRSARQGRT